MSVYRTYTRIKNQIKMFTEGFKSLMKPEWINMFSVPELQQLISGESSDVDLEDLKFVFKDLSFIEKSVLLYRSNVVYQGGYHRTHPVIKWLWQVLEQEFSREERALFLRVCAEIFLSNVKISFPLDLVCHKFKSSTIVRISFVKSTIYHSLFRKFRA